VQDKENILKISTKMPLKVTIINKFILKRYFLQHINSTNDFPAFIAHW